MIWSRRIHLGGMVGKTSTDSDFWLSLHRFHLNISFPLICWPVEFYARDFKISSVILHDSLLVLEMKISADMILDTDAVYELRYSFLYTSRLSPFWKSFSTVDQVIYVVSSS